MDWVLSLIMLAAVALLAGAVLVWRKGGRRQAGLMLVLAMVMLVNVLIWTVPAADGTTPVDRAAGP